MKKIALIAALLLLVATLVACGGTTNTSTTPTTAATSNSTPTVSMSGVAFDVPSITIPKGSTITFVTAQGGSPHNLVNGTSGLAHPEQGVPDFGTGGQTVGSGASWTSPPWTTAGTFHVTCTYHPTTMTLTVTVTG
jgi:plastocyanin